MSEKRFSLKEWEDLNYSEHCFYEGENQLSDSDVIVLLNDQQTIIKRLEEENDQLQKENIFLAKQRNYWKSKGMTLLMQVRRLTSRMTDKEVMEFSKELDDE